MSNAYMAPELSTLDAKEPISNLDVADSGAWVWQESIAFAYAYAIALVVISMIDITP